MLCKKCNQKVTGAMTPVGVSVQIGVPLLRSNDHQLLCCLQMSQTILPSVKKMKMHEILSNLTKGGKNQTNACLFLKVSLNSFPQV